MAIPRWMRVPVALLVLTSVVTGLTRITPAAAQTGGCAVNPADLALDGEEQAALDTINALRSGAGLAPLSISPSLTQAAVWKSVSMAASGVLSHDDPGRSWSQRVRECGYSGGSISENVAYGPESGRAAAAMWRDSAPHHRNIMDPNARVIGLARAPRGSVYYWTANFGSTVDGPAAFTSSGTSASPPAARSAPVADGPGGTATVNAGRGDCLNVRSAPARAATVVACLPDAITVRITGAPREADGLTWWPVEGIGWAAGSYLIITS